MRIEKTGKARFATRQRRLVKEEPSQPERQNSTCESQQARPDKFILQEPSDSIGWRFLSERSAALYPQLGVNSGGYVSLERGVSVSAECLVPTFAIAGRDTKGDLGDPQTGFSCHISWLEIIANRHYRVPRISLFEA